MYCKLFIRHFYTNIVVSKSKFKLVVYGFITLYFMDNRSMMAGLEDMRTIMIEHFSN